MSTGLTILGQKMKLSINIDDSSQKFNFPEIKNLTGMQGQENLLIYFRIYIIKNAVIKF